MSDRPDPSNIRWGDVREHIAAELESVRDALVTAPPADVPRLQGRAQALRTIVDWFEHGAINTRALKDSFSTPTTKEY